MTYESNILCFSEEQFNKGYNFNFTPYVLDDYNDLQYISWSVARRLLKQLFPTIVLGNQTHDALLNPDGTLGGINIHTTLIDITTGKETIPEVYPVMNRDGKRSSTKVLDARLINDNAARAAFKIIAIHTGIGYRLFTRESVDVGKNDKSHPKYIYMQRMGALVEKFATSKGLPDDFIAPDFSMSTDYLKETYMWLKDVA